MADYYHSCPFPKPVDKKKKPLGNGYKDKHKRYCIYCGARGAERHEVYGGINRQTSIRHGFQVDLCNAHHRELQDNITEWAQAENQKHRAAFQRQYMDKLMASGISEKDALEIWMVLIGRNYIDGLQPK